MDMFEVIGQKDEYSSEEEISIKTEDSMDIPTTVTIVEEDGTTSVVDDASIVTDPGPNNPIQFGQSSSGVTYRVVNIPEEPVFQTATGVQVISPGVNGQYYVLGSQNVIGRPVAARPQIIDARSLGRVSIAKAAHRDEKKRATHNEVERRRRDKINGWITKLSKIVPNAEEGSKMSQSKGGVLAKAFEYIQELRSTNIRLASTLKEHENTAEELDALRQDIAELRRENMMLKQQLGPTEDDSTVIITTSDD
ncbi:Upstream stimulatory factor 1 [Orchesella cincta]|uniref:Upstream stimulatory factor 1 n=1 Tax=Orchesella cincta TaxID=48709 RepID=A0A1D2MXY8_ORCCI|nr:Upstream stimulatory factor 1 [Orchesella cincta]